MTSYNIRNDFHFPLPVLVSSLFVISFTFLGTIKQNVSLLQYEICSKRSRTNFWEWNEQPVLLIQFISSKHLIPVLFFWNYTQLCQYTVYDLCTKDVLLQLQPRCQMCLQMFQHQCSIFSYTKNPFSPHSDNVVLFSSISWILETSTR